jgi:hypothetical protein
MIGWQQQHFKAIIPLLIQQTNYPIVEARKADQESILTLYQISQNFMSKFFSKHCL